MVFLEEYLSIEIFFREVAEIATIDRIRLADKNDLSICN